MLKIAVSNDLVQLDVLTSAIAEFAAKERFSSSVEMWLTLIVEELFVNFVNHGAPETGLFELSISPGESQIGVAVSDDGKPFNPLEAGAADITSPLNQRSVGNLGLHFVRQLSSGIAYERRDGRNVIAIEIPRSPPE